jgi:pilus assembly protein FimV
VFFVWENREGFLKHAKILNESVDDAADADWNKVVILGKQLCPDEEMFSGAETAAPAADSMDFEISDSGETELDFTIAGDDADTGVISEDLTADGGGDTGEGELDFDLGGGAFETTADDDLTVDLGGEAVAEDDSAKTMETPTVEVGSLNGGDTMEAPTIESPLAGTDGSGTLKAPAAVGEADSAEMTALSPEVFDAEGVDLDLGGSNDLDMDLSALDDDDEDIEATLLADAESEDEAETLLIGAESEDEAETLLTDSGDLEAEIEAELEAQADESGSDTVEQPQLDTADAEAGDTAEQPALAGNGDGDFDLEMEADGEDEMAAAVEDAALPEDATMTEVGTKLDLARAYIDMGDPDGARSILGEVLDEGGDDQQQEARQLLEELGD